MLSIISFQLYQWIGLNQKYYNIKTIYTLRFYKFISQTDFVFILDKKVIFYKFDQLKKRNRC